MSKVFSNKKANHHYHITDKFEAGLVLKGCEVKSIRQGQLSLAESYIAIKDQEAWIKKQQDDSRFYLDYESFKFKRESNKKYADKFKRISEFVSDLEFEWLNEDNSSKLPNDDLIKKRERWEESLKKDLYITEAVEILKDLSNQIKIGKPIAQHKEK